MWARGWWGQLSLGWGCGAAPQGDPRGLPQSAPTPLRPLARPAQCRALVRGSTSAWGEGGRPGLHSWSPAFPSSTREGCPQGTPQPLGHKPALCPPPQVDGVGRPVHGETKAPSACPSRPAPAQPSSAGVHGLGTGMARWRGRQALPQPGAGGVR